MAYNPFDQTSGDDPRGRIQNAIGYQQERYENQIDPIIGLMAENYGRGSEANYGDYTDIMNSYRNIASGAGSSAGGGGGGGGGDYSYSAESWKPENIKYNDPFTSYAGFQDFSQNGGYSKDDVMNMRARGVAPVRAAYANAEREVARQRALQGGYSPNAFALQGRLAREQSQFGADAMQNVEAGLAKERNTGRLAGLAGMTDIEKQRLAGDLKVQEYNTDINNAANRENVGARNAAAAGSASNRMNADLTSAAASRADQFRALQGMQSMYGATPGMAQLYGDQVLAAIGQSGTAGQRSTDQMINAQKAPGQFEQTTNRINSGIDTATKVGNLVGTVVNGINQYRNKPDEEEQKKKQPPSSGGGVVGDGADWDK